MIDYQYSDELVEMMNWGIEGEDYTVEGDTKQFADKYMNAEDPALAVADEGILASSVCRSGIAFVPLDFDAMLEVSSQSEPWWNPEEGYYVGKYWVETSKNGGEESVSPYDRAPVTYLTADYGGVCETRVKELALQFITGQQDIEDDSAWENYVADIKSQTDDDFDGILEMMNENTVK